MNPLKLLLVIITLSLIPTRINAADSLSTQQFEVTSSTGTVKIWSKEQGRWYTLKEIGKPAIGNTIETKENSQIAFTFEPAMGAVFEQNTLFNIERLATNRAKKSIRMLFTLSRGTFKIKMEPLFNNTVLLTVKTPSAIVDINSAELSINVASDITTLEIISGNAKIQQVNSDLKSMVLSGSRATVYPQKPEVLITSLSSSKPVAPLRQTVPTIAILSIQSKSVTQENLDRLSDFIADEFEKQSHTRVLFIDDIRSLLQAEGRQNLLNCYTDSCISLIGKYAGIDAVILGGLGQIGNSYMFNLKMVDVLRNKTLTRVNTTVTGDVGGILTEIPSMVNQLSTVSAVAPTAENGSFIASKSAISSDQTESTPAPYRETTIWIKGGSFSMGSKSNEGDFDETPPHTVKLRGFYIDKYEVTRTEFISAMKYNPSSVKGCDSCPVDNVSWAEANEYCRKMGKRLPTEAEWEYACKAGTTTQFSTGNTLSSHQANFDGIYPYGGAPTGPNRQRTVPVGTYPANAWNLHDMHGNAAEWCADWFDPAYYGNSAAENPNGPQTGTLKCVRGGAYNQKGAALRSGNRSGYNPTLKMDYIGFRCVKDDTAPK